MRCRALGKCRAREPIARLLAADQQSSIIINGQQSRMGSRESEVLFDLRRQFRRCLRAGPGLDGSRRMSEFRKTQSLGHCPIRSTDLRRSPGLLSLPGPRSCLPLSRPTLSLTPLIDYVTTYISSTSVGWVRGWTSTSTSTLTLTWDVSCQASSTREICEVGGITRTVPSRHSCGPSIQWYPYVCCELAGRLAAGKVQQ